MKIATEDLKKEAQEIASEILPYPLKHSVYSRYRRDAKIINSTLDVLFWLNDQKCFLEGVVNPTITQKMVDWYDRC